MGSDEGGRDDVRAGSLARNSAVRLLAYVGMVAMAFVFAVVTARWLGPADKGVLATLTFLTVALSQLACLGLGEAAIVLVGQRRAAVQDAVSACVAALLVASLAAMAALFVVASVNFWSDWGALWLTILVACVGIPAYACLTVLAQVANIHERFVATSTVQLAQVTLTAAATVALVAIWKTGVIGAVLAMTLGAAFGAVAVVVLLRQRGYSLRPRVDPRFLRPALPYGLKVQLSGPPPITDRADLVLVYALGGQAAAGRYSVALTLATMVGLAPLAVSHVSFPRLARSSPADAEALIARTCRYGLAAAVLVAGALVVLVPLLLPVVFGEPYAPAVTPALVLLVAYLFSSAQWLLGRAAAARGNAAILAWSYGTNLAVMVTLDLFLIPAFGITGAAVGSALGSIVGAAICAVPYRRPTALGGLGRFLPRRADFRDLVSLPRRVAAAREPAAAPIPAPRLPE